MKIIIVRENPRRKTAKKTARKATKRKYRKSKKNFEFSKLVIPAILVFSFIFWIIYILEQ